MFCPGCFKLENFALSNYKISSILDFSQCIFFLLSKLFHDSYFVSSWLFQVFNFVLLRLLHVKNFPLEFFFHSAKRSWENIIEARENAHRSLLYITQLLVSALCKILSFIYAKNLNFFPIFKAHFNFLFLLIKSKQYRQFSSTCPQLN